MQEEALREEPLQSSQAMQSTQENERVIFPSLRKRFARMHGDEGGAILMLMLAGTLICLMVTLVLYDAGLATTDKMNSQIAADTAAFSGSVVKARSMNLISVANTNKRMIYGIETVYNAAFMAIVESYLIYLGRCLKLPPDLSACGKLIQGSPQTGLAILEFFNFHLPMQLTTSRREVKLLEKYQGYLKDISPWWTWIEAALRGTANDGTFSATWPPPGDVSEIFDKVTQVTQGVDFLFGSSISSIIPSHSNATDGLPIARRETQSPGAGLPGPFGSVFGGLSAAGSACLGLAFSVEHGMLFAEYMSRTGGIGDDGQTIGLYAASFIPSCLITWGTISSDFFDYQLSGTPMIPNPLASTSTTSDDWLQATSLTAFGYQARGGRNTTDRERLNYMKQDYNSATSLLMRNEGQFAMARSEIVYQTTNPLANALGGLSFPGGFNLRALVDRPEMWHPAWTAKLRPVTLPGEKHGATVVLMGDGSDIGLSEMGIDMVPFVVVASLIGMLDKNMKIGSTLEDFLFFVRASGSFNAENMEGIPK